MTHYNGPYRRKTDEYDDPHYQGLFKRKSDRCARERANGYMNLAWVCAGLAAGLFLGMWLIWDVWS